MKRVLLRVERLLHPEGARGRFALGAFQAQPNPFESFPNPMHARIRWRPMRTEDPHGEREAYDDDGGLIDDWRFPNYMEYEAENRLEITAPDGKTTTLHWTWFVSKESVQRFLDVLSEQVTPDTTADTFAALVTALIRLQVACKRPLVTVVGPVWQHGRRTAALAIAPAFLADKVPNAAPLVIPNAAPLCTERSPAVEIEDDWVRMYIRPASGDAEGAQFVLWHVPRDADTHLTMVLESPRTRVRDPVTRRWRAINDETSPEFVPPWSQWLPRGPPGGRLIYYNQKHLFIPQRAHHGERVTWVEYFEDKQAPAAWEADTFTALTQLFKPDADPIVVGQGFCATKTLRQWADFSRTRRLHHWHLVWPIEYREHTIRPDHMRIFFIFLISIAYPEYTTKIKKRDETELYGVRYECSLWNGPDDALVPVGLYFECVVGRTNIKVRVAPRNMKDTSDADTDVEFTGE
jgi:hypothetical protein